MFHELESGVQDFKTVEKQENKLAALFCTEDKLRCAQLGGVKLIPKSSSEIREFGKTV